MRAPPPRCCEVISSATSLHAQFLVRKWDFLLPIRVPCLFLHGRVQTVYCRGSRWDLGGHFYFSCWGSTTFLFQPPQSILGNVGCLSHGVQLLQRWGGLGHHVSSQEVFLSSPNSLFKFNLLPLCLVLEFKKTKDSFCCRSPVLFCGAERLQIMAHLTSRL